MPAIQPCALYRHFAADGELLYVGISLNALNRLGQHRLNADWFDKIARVEIEQFPSRAVAVEAERNAIREEKPRHNVLGARLPSALAALEAGPDRSVLPDFSPLLTETEAAQYLRVSLSTLRRNRAEKRPPKFLKQRGRVFYTQKALDQYIAFSERGE